MDRRRFLQFSGMAALGLYCNHVEGLQMGSAASPASPAKKITILGAGVAGLAAGLELTKAGHDVLILEAQMRPGGRVYTVRSPFSDGLHAEAGAGRIPSTHDLTLAYVKRYNLELDPFFPQSGATVFLWRGNRQVVPYKADPVLTNLNLDFTPEERKLGFGGLPTKYMEPLQNQVRALPADSWPCPTLSWAGNITFADYLRKQGASSDAIQYLSLGFEKDSTLDMIHDSISHDVPMLWKIRGGNDRLPHAMASELNDKVRYGSKVVRIVQKPKNVEITYTNAGDTHTIVSDRVICALPYTVLRGIEVSPAWSTNKGYAIRNLHMGSVARVFVQTKTRFWESDGRNGFATVDQPMEIWSPTYKEAGTRGILMSYIYESLADEYSRMNEDAQMQRTLDLYEQVHPGVRQHFEGGATWSWLNHPYSKGAFLDTLPGDFQTIIPYVATPEGRIHFAGEHTSPWPGWMQGGLHSGLRTAKEVTTASS